MTLAPRHVLAGLLEGAGDGDAFSTRRTAPVKDLTIEVTGVGTLALPVPEAQVRQLIAIARPARFGRGEETLTDREIRDTYEVAKSRVRIDPEWRGRVLAPLLDKIRDDLGLPASCRLTAELHAFLVYGTGQFFVPHRDSEKSDGMVATLSMMLPGRSGGGALVVEHAGRTLTYRPSERLLTFVAFYADCRHEVRPVRSGHRLSLTFNLLLTGDSSATSPAPASQVAMVADVLAQHFQERNRLVYLLDHQYTERALHWQRLKGADAAQVAVLRKAAEAMDCDLALALAEIHETWDAEPAYGSGSSWSFGDFDDEDEADVIPSDLIEDEIVLDTWLDAAGQAAEPIAARVDDEEVCTSTPTSAITPDESAYEGYMGNYGNTIDRWYRRAAVVVWPRKAEFVVRAQLSPAWALGRLATALDDGKRDEASDHARSLRDLWAALPAAPAPLAASLAVAEAVNEADLAEMLLRPYGLESLHAADALELARVAERYGQNWFRGQAERWEAGSPRWDRAPRLVWAADLPRLIVALDAAGGHAASRQILAVCWTWLRGALHDARGGLQPSARTRQLADLTPAVAGVLVAAGGCEAAPLSEEIVRFLDDERLIDCACATLRAVAAAPAATWDNAAVRVLAELTSRRLADALARPARTAGDWAMALPRGCICELCQALEEFLADRDQVGWDWRLKEQHRRHIHQRIDQHELPVAHSTRRTGSPYTLVLTKLPALFERERQQRRAWEAELHWITEHGVGSIRGDDAP